METHIYTYRLGGNVSCYGCKFVDNLNCESVYSFLGLKRVESLNSCQIVFKEQEDGDRDKVTGVQSAFKMY